MEMELDQIIGYLNGEQLSGYYDGIVPCPSSSVTGHHVHLIQR